MKHSGLIRLLFLLFILIVGISTYFLTGLNQLSPTQFKDWIEGFGVLSGLIFILIYAIAPVFYIPGSILSISAGIIFGPLIGTILVLIGATAGATFAFIIARYFGESIKDKIEKTKFLNIDKANKKIEQNGFLFVFILRLIPLFPYNLLNYGLGLTKVRSRDYFFATLFGMIPGIFAYVYLGSNLLSVNSPTFYLALVIFLLVMVVPLILRKHVKI